MSDSTLWTIEPHTKAKHEILTYYLKAWYPIQSRAPKRLLYIDGFAGPGEYQGREPGSPILALGVVTGHQLLARLTRPGMELVFVFIEERQDRFDNLKSKLDAIGTTLPSNVVVRPICGTFEYVVGQQLALLEEQGKRLAPSLVFIDPFGPIGFSMSLVRQILRQPRAEVLINFSYQPLNRWFLSDAHKHDRLNELFGDDRWRPALNIADPRAKEDFLVAEYRGALEQGGCRVASFRMVNKHNHTQYYLLFGTRHYLGMLAMKRAMWKAAPEGDFEYSDRTGPNPKLFQMSLDEEYSIGLANRLCQARRGQTVTKEALLQQDLALDEVCIEHHLRRALCILEYERTPPGIVAVQTPSGKRKQRTYPDGCRITFAP